MTEMPTLITSSKAPSGELYSMECTLEVSRRSVLNNVEEERTCKWSGYASLDVVNSMLDSMLGMMKEVVGE